LVARSVLLAALGVLAIALAAAAFALRTPDLDRPALEARYFDGQSRYVGVYPSVTCTRRQRSLSAVM
jgi:hypothetical protein